MLLEDVRGQNILDHLDELEVPIIDGKDRRNLPLRRPQRDAIRKLLNWFENYVPTQVANVPLKTYKDSPPIDNAFLMVLPQRIGKTIAFSIAACRALEKTGKPSIYLHFEIPSLPDVEKVFVEVFRAYFGRDPIIHTFYDGKTFDEGVPDLVISSPQTQTGWEWKFAKKHPAQQRSYSALFADEAWGWATITRERLLREFDADYKIGMTGMKHRLDDVRNVKKYVRPGAATEYKHRIERIFGHAKSEYSLSQAFEDGELQKPNVRLFATNEGPTMHEILRGKYDKRKLNIHQKSMRINLDYLDVNLTIYAEKDFAQHLIYSKTKNHLNDMQMLHEGLKNPAQLVETFSQNEDWVDLVPRLEELLEKHERAIKHIIANDTEIIPIHSGLSPKIKNENRDRFLSPVPGAIGLAVDMLRSSVSLKHLGYTFQTGNTSSVQKWMQTAMRMVGNDDAEVIDVSNSFELISQVLRNSPRYEKIWHLVEHHPKRGPQEIPLNDLRLDEQHMLLNEVEAAFPEPEDFMFALHAHAFKLWSQRSSRASKKVAIKLPATIECANGIMVKLSFEENPNVHDWLKDLPPSSDGGLDLDPDQLALLEKLDVPTRYDEIQEYVNSISVNVPEKRHQRKVEKAKEYFESDTFWEGLEAFKKMRAHVAERLNLDDYYDYNIHDGVITGKYLFNSNSRIRKYFDSDVVDENELETVEGTGTKFNLRTWYKNAASHFPYASDYIRIGCFNDGIIFEDEVILRELVQKTFDDLDSQIDGISQTGTVVLEKFKVEPETQIALGELGTFTTTHRTTFSAFEVLEAQAKHVLATEGPRAYLKTAYFSVAVSAYEKWKVQDNEAMLPNAKEITLHTGPHSGLPFSLLTPDAPRGVNPDGSEKRKYFLKEKFTFEFSEWYKTVTSPEFVQELSESEIQWLNYIGVSARVPSEFELALAYATNVTNEQIETDRHATHSISLHSNKQFVVFDKGAGAGVRFVERAAKLLDIRAAP